MLEIPPGYPHAGRLLSGSLALYSDDRGATWHEATLAPGQDSYAQVFTIFPSGRVLMTNYSGMAVSDDGGESYGPAWFGPAFSEVATAIATPGSIQSGTPDCGLADASQCEGAIVFGSSGVTLPGASVWWTNDGGRTWSAPVNIPQPDDGVRYSYTAGVAALAPGPDGLGRAVAVLGRGVVHTTVDGGVTWQAVGRLPFGGEIEIGTQSATLMRLGPDGHLWVSTFGGRVEATGAIVKGWIYRSLEPAEAAFAVASEAPPSEAPRLGVTVRPNPASGRVSVVVTSAGAESVRVVVVDARGREVAVVLDGPVSGERVVSLDTSSLAPGVYVVRASAGETHATARLVVAR